MRDSETPMPARRSSIGIALVAVALGASSSRRAFADAASAEAQLPAGREPFLLVTTTTTVATKFDDVSRRPEYVVYPDGTFLVQKSDNRLWGTKIARAEVVELLRFVLEDAGFASIDMRYLLSSPLTTFTQFTLTTRSGTYAARKRASGGYGPGVKDGEKALGAVETKLIAIADRAQALYTPGALLVVSKRTSPGDATPTWAANDILPFAALVDATDVERQPGAVYEGAQAEAIRAAIAMGPEWRFGITGAELRARPALPHERTAAVAPPPPTPRTGDDLPKPPPMTAPTPPPPPPPRRSRRRRPPRPPPLPRPASRPRADPDAGARPAPRPCSDPAARPRADPDAGARPAPRPCPDPASRPRADPDAGARPAPRPCPNPGAGPGAEPRP